MTYLGLFLIPTMIKLSYTAVHVAMPHGEQLAEIRGAINMHCTCPSDTVAWLKRHSPATNVMCIAHEASTPSPKRESMLMGFTCPCLTVLFVGSRRSHAIYLPVVCEAGFA